eukprot:NODE_643_length_5630_cov_0.163623.p1 type:complete len:965 gc:universal NODE_643_length_5630_cov_0.163623:4950-2056(-)
MLGASEFSSETISTMVRLKPGNSIWKKNENHLMCDKGTFYFNKIFENESNNDIFNHCWELMRVVLQGINTTCFTYGQTSSGKTYTLLGTGSDPGLLPLTLQQLFKINGISIKISYIEVYNELLKDLLEPENVPKLQTSNKRVTISNLLQIKVDNFEEAMNYLKTGEQSRKYGNTDINEHSSRSHALFQIHIERQSEDKTIFGLLTLVDLAGSERIKHTSAEGARLKEGQMINKSLLALGTVIQKLSEKQAHVPFRDSKLTRILQNSLGGYNRTIAICCISPSIDHIDESISTLKFALKTMRVENKPLVNESCTEEQLVNQYKLKINELQEQLENKEDSIDFLDQIEWYKQQQILLKQRIYELELHIPHKRRHSTDSNANKRMKYNYPCADVASPKDHSKMNKHVKNYHKLQQLARAPKLKSPISLVHKPPPIISPILRKQIGLLSIIMSHSSKTELHHKEPVSFSSKEISPVKTAISTFYRLLLNTATLLKKPSCKKSLLKLCNSEMPVIDKRGHFFSFLSIAKLINSLPGPKLEKANKIIYNATRRMYPSCSLHLSSILHLKQLLKSSKVVNKHACRALIAPKVSVNTLKFLSQSTYSCLLLIKSLGFVLPAMQPCKPKLVLDENEYKNDMKISSIKDKFVSTVETSLIRLNHQTHLNKQLLQTCDLVQAEYRESRTYLYKKSLLVRKSFRAIRLASTADERFKLDIGLSCKANELASKLNAELARGLQNNGRINNKLELYLKTIESLENSKLKFGNDLMRMNLIKKNLNTIKAILGNKVVYECNLSKYKNIINFTKDYKPLQVNKMDIQQTNSGTNDCVNLFTLLKEGYARERNEMKEILGVIKKDYIERKKRFKEEEKGHHILEKENQVLLKEKSDLLQSISEVAKDLEKQRNTVKYLKEKVTAKISKSNKESELENKVAKLEKTLQEAQARIIMLDSKNKKIEHERNSVGTMYKELVIKQ